MENLKVVVDTNILVGGAYDESSVAFKIIKEVIDGQLEAYATHQTMSENRQILRKLVRDREYRELLEEFFRRLKIVKLTPSSPPPSFQEGERETGSFSSMIRGRLRGGRVPVSDPEDVKLFESSLAAEADYLITKDNEVLDVGEYHGTKVVTPEEFWAKYRDENDNGGAWGDWAKMIMGK